MVQTTRIAHYCGTTCIDTVKGISKKCWQSLFIVLLIIVQKKLLVADSSHHYPISLSIVSINAASCRLPIFQKSSQDSVAKYLLKLWIQKRLEEIRGIGQVTTEVTETEATTFVCPDRYQTKSNRELLCSLWNEYQVD